MRTPTRSLPLLLLTVLAAGPAAAGEGLYLTWGDCAQGALASHGVTSSCDSDLGQQTLYCAFTVAAPVDSVLGVQVVVDLQHSAVALPDWWRFDPAGCRAGELRGEFDFTLESACTDVFDGLAQGGLLGYYPTQPRGGANQARILVAASRLRDYGSMRFGPYRGGNRPNEFMIVAAAGAVPVYGGQEYFPCPELLDSPRDLNGTLPTIS